MPKIIKVCDDLYMSPTIKAGEKGNGMVITCDQCSGNPLYLNIEKPTYKRDSFSETHCEIDNNILPRKAKKQKTRMACVYGVGSGLVSHGTPVS